MACDESAEISLWYCFLGVIWIIMASSISSLGANLQKYSFLVEVKRDVTDRRTYYRQPKWAAGMLMVIFGNLIFFVALGFAPQILITTVGGGFTLVGNVFWAHCFLNEAFRRSDAIATAVIIGGVIQAVLFIKKGDKCLTLADLVTLYYRVAFIVYAAIISVICIVLVRLVKHLEHLHQLFGPSSEHYAKYRRIHPVLYPVLSGLFGAQAVLLAKSTAELFKVTFEGGDNQFAYFGTYLIVITLFVCIFLQTHWLAQGLQRYDAVFVIPVFQCSNITTSIAAGGVYFDEFKSMSTFQILMFTIGIIATLSGVVLMSQRSMDELIPQQEFKASIKVDAFIKRIQKALGIRNPKVDTGPIADYESIQDYVQDKLSLSEEEGIESASLLTCDTPQNMSSLNTSEVTDLKQRMKE